jgi:CO dehydrogenase maturation factor
VIAAVVGKGGVGKTTVTSLLLRSLLDAGETPVLAVDADPSSCLAPALGLAAPRSLGDLREELRDEKIPAAVSKAEWLAVRAEEALVESRGFDLLTMGRPEGPGCYCFVNTLLRDHLGRFSQPYRHVLVDCEAGLEHLSRRTAGRPDALVCVTSRSRQAAETVARALALFEGLHGSLPARVDLVLNGFAPGDGDAARAEEIAAGGRAAGTFARRVFVPDDPAVRSHELERRSLLELDAGSPALAALRSYEVWR